MEASASTLSKYEGNSRWLREHYEDLKKSFRDEWVAVLNCEVVDSDKDLRALVDRLRKKYPEKYGEIAIEFVTEKEIELILHSELS